MTIHEFLARVEQKTPTDGQWLVKCPGHDDRQASLAVREGAEGRIVLFCHAGCTTKGILAEMQLTEADLFAQPLAVAGTRKREIAAYNYLDETGTLLYQSVRFEPKDFRARRRDGHGGWIWSLKDVRRVVYRLPEMKGHEAVVIVEGEKDVDRLWSIGIPATCNIGGGGKWRDDYTQQLIAAGVKRIRIIPDNDPAGSAHAEQVRTSWTIAAMRCVPKLDVQIVTLPDVPEKGDVSDYLDRHDRNDLIALLKAEPTSSPISSVAAATSSDSHQPTSRRADKTAPQGRAVVFEDQDPWPDTVQLADVLDEIHGVLTRFLVLADGAADAIALWVVHTYLMDIWTISPFLTINSPIKQCGKTRLMTVVKAIVYRALTTSNITAAALFRVIDKHGPTLLMDEAENFVNDKNNELLGVLNAGHTRDTAQVVRTEGDKHEPMVFSTWAAKVVALIGKLSDTTMDRSIVIPMRRRTSAEPVALLRYRVLAETCLPLRRRLGRCADEYRDRLGQCDPDMPSGLRDRDQDNWAPLLAIADAAGGVWPTRARRAALLLSGEESTDDSPGLGLLEDCRIIRDEIGGEVIASAELVKRLNELEGRPWADLKGGKGITTNWLAKHLSDFRVKSAGTLRIPGAVKTKKGYRWAAFEDAWARYVPGRDGQCDGSDVRGDGSCDGSQPQIDPMNTVGCYDVTAVTVLRGVGPEGAIQGRVKEADGWLEL